MKKITIGVAAILMATLQLLADIQMAADGTYVNGQPQMAPNGQYLGSGKIEMAPNGTYIAVESEDEEYYNFDYQEPEEGE